MEHPALAPLDIADGDRDAFLRDVLATFQAAVDRAQTPEQYRALASEIRAWLDGLEVISRSALHHAWTAEAAAGRTE